MYKDFFGLKEYPFSLTSDPRFMVFSPGYNEVLAALYYGVEMAKGLIVLTGEVGTGKTTALRWIIRRLDSTVLAVHFLNPHVSIEEFYHHLAATLGIKEGTNKTDLLMELGRMLEERHGQGLRTLLMVDDAQELPDEVLEEIGLLLNFESDGAKHLQIILNGPPELREKLNQQNLTQLKQLVALRCQMPILSTVEEVNQYIQTRISTGGSVDNDIFTPEAVDLINQCSKGVPRLINNLCDNAMISAFLADTRSIDREIIEEVAENLDLLPYRDVPGAGIEASRASGSGS